MLYPQTVMPARYMAFPAASFIEMSDAIAYANEMLALGVSGVIMCPANSYSMHIKDTLGAKNA